MTDRPVRALFVNENIGGHATVHHHLRVVAADRTDIEIRVVDVPPPGFWRKVMAAPVPGLSRIDADLRPVRYQLAQSAWVARQLPRWLAGSFDTPVDVVHLYTHNVALLAGRALSGLPTVVTLDSTNAQSNLLHPLRPTTRFSGASLPLQRPLERAVHRRARRIVANSRWCADSLTADYGVDPAKISIVPMGVPLPDALPDRVPAPGLPRLVFIGRSLERKGGLDLLAAHRRWLAGRCELVLVTQDRVSSTPGVTVVNDIVPGDGRVDELLSGAAIMLLPSRIDQWPNAVMEAMAQGVPPIVSAVGGLPEMVLHGAAGVVLPEVSPESIRDAVTGLLDDPERLAAIGDRARRRVVEDLDVRLTANRLLDIVRDAAR